MKQKSLIGLVILMSLSLMGIVIAQFLWVHQAIDVQREKFAGAVLQSLENTVIRLERERSAQFMINTVLPRLGVDANSLPQVENSTVVIKAGRIPGLNHVIQSRSDTFYTDQGTRVQTRVQINKATSDQQIWITEDREKDGVAVFEKQFKQMDDSISKMLQIVQENEEELRAIFNQISYEMTTRQDPLTSRLDLNNLNSILKTELKRNGITTRFEYCVYDKDKKQVSDFKSKGFTLKALKQDHPISVDLFPNDIFRGYSPYELVVHFPDLATYLVKSQGWMLLLSITFTLFIVLTFFYTFRTILTQKKVAQIKSDFINNMTHEFKTPIATISLAADSLLMPVVMENPTQTRNFLRIIKEENARMNNHVERVLQMSLIENKDFSVILSPLDVHHIITSAVDSIKLMLEGCGGVINLQLQASHTTFNVDEIHFKNVIVNLLENALKYSKETPLVDIITENSGLGLLIIIKDNGIGMSREQQNNIFEKFYRAQGGNVHNVKGFGLGLSYVKAVLDAHQAKISVVSKLEVGTEFSIFLPSNK